MPEYSRGVQLAASDARNLLSQSARLRVDHALDEQYVIRTTAMARILARLDGRDWDGKAREQWSRAKMKAACIVLSAYVQELSAAGKRGRELLLIIEGEMEGAFNSLELSKAEQMAVRSKVFALQMQLDSSCVPDMPAPDQHLPTVQDDPFATQQLRSAAIGDAMARRSLGSQGRLARELGVDRSDLNKWKLQRHEGLSPKNGRSARADQIEKNLTEIFSEQV